MVIVWFGLYLFGFVGGLVFLFIYLFYFSLILEFWHGPVDLFFYHKIGKLCWSLAQPYKPLWKGIIFCSSTSQQVKFTHPLCDSEYLSLQGDYVPLHKNPDNIEGLT